MLQDWMPLIKKLAFGEEVWNKKRREVNGKVAESPKKAVLSFQRMSN